MKKINATISAAQNRISPTTERSRVRGEAVIAML